MATDTDPEMFARRASCFGAEAAAYAEHRPDYPLPGVRWALGSEDDRRGTLDVLDLGAGTGKLSAALLALGHRVTAVEPDADMRGQLERLLPSVTALAGGAEEIPLADASVDAVVVGQAFHWFDQERAMPEIARVLRPGGTLGALWNTDDDRVEWIAELGRVSSSRVSYIDWHPGKGMEKHAGFTAVEYREFAHRQPRTIDSMLATITTHSHILTLEPAEREPLLARIRDYLATRPETSGGSFDLEIVTRVQRCAVK
ncbi:class I SAM-dependent methyltransferase [Streptomyces sp. CBMA29]|uniref:class I SAM-dependent methyltransferase n=1 Tax=Streptomyces sp. CBMA29 TaxID=1896314 RepID=UPI0016619F39|nr:class I SAM-dependent methyltransferase [Streptomyces sp. CBMA29]MBD0738999.1 hypothetical protein [Streptomyces sp. CBMA29]